MEHFDSTSGSEAEALSGVVTGGGGGPGSGRPTRRSFSVQDKQRLVAEYDATPRGYKGAMLRRERLYDSHITEWRAAIAAGTLDAPPRRGRAKGSTSSRSPERARIAELERENAKLRAEVEAKDTVIAAREEALDVLGKVSRSWNLCRGGTRDEGSDHGEVDGRDLAERDRQRVDPAGWCGRRLSGWWGVRELPTTVTPTRSRGCRGRGANRSIPRS